MDLPTGNGGRVRAAGHEYYGLGVFAASDDDRFLANAEDLTGAESYVLRVNDLETGEDLRDELTKVYYSCAWTNDSSGFYYTMHDDAMRPQRVYMHRLGTAQTGDVLILEETDERFSCPSRSHGRDDSSP